MNDIRPETISSIDDINDCSIVKKMMVGSSLSDSSRGSEIYSSYVMNKIFGSIGISCKLYKTECSIGYIWIGSVTDYIFDTLVDDSHFRIAIEVKRIHTYPNVTICPAYVNRILNKANTGAIESNRNVIKEDRWDMQMLHIITSSSSVFDMVAAWSKDIHNTGFGAIFITIVDGNSDFIF